MKKLIYVIISVLLLSPAIGAAGSLEKIVLLPFDESSSIRVENLFVSPQVDRPPMIAFYGEGGQEIFIYDSGKEKISRFKFQESESLMSSSALSFVTFCWDKKKRKDGRFAVVFSTYGKKLVFHGGINDKEQLKRPTAIGENATGFNYYDGALYYVNLGNGRIERSPADFLSSNYTPKESNLSIVDFKMVEKDGEPYFILRNVVTNGNGIFKGEDFKKIVDDPDVDELYPHYSPDGKLLGYIERQKRTGSARVCLKCADRPVVKSKFTFAIKENALLREYSRMFFIGDGLYYFIKEPDLNSKNEKFGLFVLSEKGENVFTLNSEIISVSDKVYDYLTDKVGKLETIRESTAVKDIFPFEYKKSPYFVLLTNSHSYKVASAETPAKIKRYWINSQAIIIVDSRILKEEK